jgi:hypothetical protein
MANACEVKGCKHEAHWAARKLFGKGETLHVCDEHKPDASRRPEALRHLPFFYDVQPIGIYKSA